MQKALATLGNILAENVGNLGEVKEMFEAAMNACDLNAVNNIVPIVNAVAYYLGNAEEATDGEKEAATATLCALLNLNEKTKADHNAKQLFAEMAFNWLSTLD